MKSTIKKVVLIAIILISVMILFLSYEKYNLHPKWDYFADDFCFNAKGGDSISLNYPIEKDEVKKALFLIFDIYNESGNSSCKIIHCTDSASIYKRKVKIENTSLIYNSHIININDSITDTIVYKSKINVFRILHNTLILKNEGLIKTAILLSEKQKITFNNPVLIITGETYSEVSMDKKIDLFYKILPVVLILLGFIYWRLNKTKKV